MLTKAEVKFIQSLRQKKGREEHNVFVAEGVKMVEELLSSALKVKQIYSSRNFQHSIFSNHIEVIRISEKELARISSLVTPNQMLAICEMPDYKLGSLKNRLSLVLDGLQDPGNMGTIIRIADWFGIDDIICSPDTVDVYNPKAVQATMGSIARIRVHYAELKPLLDEAISAGVKVFGASLEGEDIYTSRLSKKGMIVIGNESKGISEALQASVSDKLRIPSFPHTITTPGGPESLNAAIATAVICSEFKRRG